MTESKRSDPRITLRNRLAGSWRYLFLVYFILLTIGTHLPSTRLSIESDAVLPDKLIHLFAFMVLTLLLWRSRLLSLTL